MLYFPVILVFFIAMFMKQKSSFVLLFSQAVCEARLMNQYGDVMLFLEKVYSSFQEILKVFKVISDIIFHEYFWKRSSTKILKEIDTLQK